MTLSDCPDMDEGHVDGYAGLSGRSFDAADRDDLVTGGDEFFGDKANVKSSIEIGEKAFGDVLEAFEMAGADRHPVR